jgi:hypothetical protein
MDFGSVSARSGTPSVIGAASVAVANSRKLLKIIDIGRIIGEFLPSLDD